MAKKKCDREKIKKHFGGNVHSAYLMFCELLHNQVFLSNLNDVRDLICDENKDSNQEELNQMVKSNALNLIDIYMCNKFYQIWEGKKFQKDTFVDEITDYLFDYATNSCNLYNFCVSGITDIPKN